MKNLSTHFTFSLMLLFLLSILIFGCNSYNIHDALVKGDDNALLNALKSGADVNELNAEGMSPLHVAVAKHDTLATRLLFKFGAKYDIVNKKGQYAIYDAIINAIGSDVNEYKKAIKTKDINEPSIKILRMFMSKFRKSLPQSTDIDITGKLLSSMELAGTNSDGSLQLVSKVTIETSGKVYDVSLSRKETEFINIAKSGTGSNWNIDLISGGLYHIKGTQTGEMIEATMLSLENASSEENKLTTPIRDWLPYTEQSFIIIPWVKNYTVK